MIKILTGWSNIGGSTFAHIGLTNLFNNNGIECSLYGPHSWHLDRCKSDILQDLRIRTDDTLIVHFIDTNWTVRPPVKGKVIYSCHEKDVKPIKSFYYNIYDKIHYVSNPQRKWHDVDHPYFVCPNVVNELQPSKCKRKKIAGIIGSVDRNKQTHISIQRALDDGMEEVNIFGVITDYDYFRTDVEKLIDTKVVKFRGYRETQVMYDFVTDVYLSSLSETWSYIPKECKMTGVNFHGTDAINGNFDIDLTNEEILEFWKRELELDNI